MKIIIISLLLIIVFSSNKDFNLQQKRVLQSGDEIYFINASHLLFSQEEKRWNFNIKYYSSNNLANDKDYSVSILYNNEPTLANCISGQKFNLICSFLEKGQSRYDLIKLNPERNNANIIWKNLTKIYEIPIDCSLTFKESYPITYEYSNYFYYFTFELEIEEDILPEDALVKIDIKFGEKNIVCPCYYSDYYLQCDFAVQWNLNWICQILPKNASTVEWLNIDKKSKIYVPIKNELDILSKAYNLQLINLKWNFKLNCRATIGGNLQAITINVKTIKPNGDTNLYLTKCISYTSNYGTSDKNLYLDCVVEGNNQHILDLVYISNTSYYNPSIIWKTYSFKDYLINRPVNLKFIKAYDFFDYSSIKILVEDDENLPNKAEVSIDTVFWMTSILISSSEQKCIYANHILNCDFKETGNSYLYKIYALKRFGSITWTNLREMYISILRNYTLDFVSSHGLFFTDRWYFIVKVNADYYNTLPYQSLVLIDIIHNSKEVTATCEFKTYSDMICFSDYESQSETDTIKLRKYRKYGTITWKNIIQDDIIPKAIPINNRLPDIYFYDALDMYFSKEGKWIFYIYGKISGEKYEGTIKVGIIIIKSSGNKIESTANCLVLYTGETNFPTKFLCKADYDNQESNDLIQMNPNNSSLSTITWTNYIKSNHLITLKASLFLVKYGWNTINRRRYYNITIKSEDDLPIGSKLILDLDYDYSIKIINCTLQNNTFIFCNMTESEGGYPLNYLKSPKSSVTWLNKIDDEPFYIIRTEKIKLISADRLYYKESEKKWHFNLTVSNTINKAKYIMDILYGESPEIATCKSQEKILFCVVNLDEQDRNTLIKLTTMKSTKSTLTWNNLLDDTLIPLWTELTLDKTENLKRENNKWVFNILVKDNNIPDNSLIILDLFTIYTNLNDNEYEDLNTIDCIYNSNKLKCETNEIGSNYCIRIITTKNKYSKSTVTKWNNVNGDKILLNLETDLEFYYSTRINKNEHGKYIFSIAIQNNIPKYSQCTVDILIGNKQDISICIADSNSLNCEIEESKYISNDIYLSKTKTSLSSITWTNLYENQLLYSIRFEFIHAYYKRPEIYNDNYYYFNILINEENNIKNNLIFPVKIFSIWKYKNVTYYNRFFIPCQKNNTGILSCIIDIIYDDDSYELFIETNGEDGLIDWINPGNYSIDKTQLYTIKYNNIFYCIYDDINNYYNYSLKIDYDNNSPKANQFVMDLLINDNYLYSTCNKNDLLENIFDCHTQKIEKLNNHIIKIKNMFPINGNTELKNIPNDNFIIYPNDVILVKPSYIYDLKFNSNIWEFKIKPLNNIQIVENKKLNIVINNNQDYANCKENDDYILCRVNSESQQNNQLIKLSQDYTFSDYIYLSNINRYEIPLIAEFELINSLDLKYNNGWSFVLQVLNNNNLIIPSGSIFSIDIKYNDNSYDLAFCSIKNKKDNELTLLCIPQNKIENNTLITLSNTEKSEYASVTWNPSLLEKDTYIYFIVTLNVTQIYMTESENNNNFYMVVTNIDMPFGGRVILDIIYNNNDEIAICILKEKNKFECYPNISNQNPDDTFSISLSRKYGTITFINSANKLKFLSIFNYVKAYNLKYETKWTFNIELYNCKVKNGKSFEINILIDDEEDIADCIYNNNILACEINNKNQDQFSIIKIINEYNDDIVWINLPDILTLYYEEEFKFINMNGGFINKKWTFNIYYEPVNKNKKMYNNNYLLDVTINNIESYAICESTYSSFLKCIVNYNDQNINDIVKININKEKKLGTLNFQKIQIEPEKSINYASFSINYSLNLGYINQNDNLEIIIEGTLQRNMEYDLEEDTLTMIELVKYINEGKNYYDVICSTNNIKKEKGSYIYMICETDLSIDNNKIEINIGSDRYSKFVQFSQKNNIEIKYDGNDGFNN